MRNSLQYAYSIMVFFGVLVSAYLMMSSETNARIPMRSFQAPVYRTETMVVDPALNQLFEVEDALSLKAKSDEGKRLPAKNAATDND